jgi:hypothetical protein
MVRGFTFTLGIALALAFAFEAQANPNGPAKTPTDAKQTRAKDSVVQGTGNAAEKKIIINKVNDKLVEKKIINVGNLPTSKTPPVVPVVLGKNQTLLAKNFLGGKLPLKFSPKTPAKVQAFCYHHNYWGWTSFCWLTNYDCYGYWDPSAACWYYYYPEFCCYLPVSYIEVYVPVVVVTTPAPDATAAAPTLPSGAQALPAQFNPTPPELPPDE